MISCVSCISFLCFRIFNCCALLFLWSGRSCLSCGQEGNPAPVIERGINIFLADYGGCHPCRSYLLSASRCWGCAPAGWPPTWPRGRAGGRPPSRDLHAPLVRLCSLVVFVSHCPSRAGWGRTALIGGDACHVGTDTRARPLNRAEALKASGTVLWWRHPLTPRWSVWVKKRQLKARGVTQPSCLNYWVYSAPQDPCPTHIVRRSVVVAPRYPVVVPWESGSSSRYRD